MEKEFVPFEQALQMRELGFSQPCLGYYDMRYPTKLNIEKPDFLESQKKCDFIFGTDTERTFLAPLWQQAFRWFAEKYDLYSFIEWNRDDAGVVEYIFVISDPSDDDIKEYIEIDDYQGATLDEAQLMCLKTLIELVNDIQNERTY